MGELTTTDTTVENRHAIDNNVGCGGGGGEITVRPVGVPHARGLYRGRSSGVGGSADSEAYNERVSVEYTCCVVPSSRSGMYQRPAATVPLPALLAVPAREELGAGETRPEERASTECTTTPAEGATER